MKINTKHARHHAYIISALALLLCSGCGLRSSKSDASSDGDAQIQTNYAPSLLPFDVDPGVERMRGIYRMPSPENDEHVEDEPGLLIGVAALPDHAVVAFPAKDRSGYNIAHAEALKPWASLKLNDLNVEEVGAVAASQSRDGEAWFAFREREAPHAITLWRWRPGETPQQVAFTRAEAAQLPEHSNSCPDIDLSIQDDGTVDLIYRQSERELRHARKTPGSNTWEDTLIVKYEDNDPIHDVGCVVRVEHDENHVPNVLSWVRDGSTKGAAKTIPRAAMNGRNIGWFRSHTGAWLPSGRLFSEVAGPGYFGPSGTEMVMVGESHLLIGSTYFGDATDEKGIALNPISTTPRPWLTPTYDIRLEDVGVTTFKRCTDSFHVARTPTYGLSLMRTGTGAITSLHPSEWKIFRSRACKTHGDLRVPPRLAPVLTTDRTSDLRSPAAAHGKRPYDLVVCLDREGRLEVCAGGISTNGLEKDPPGLIVTNAWTDSRAVDAGAQTFYLDVEQVSEEEPGELNIEVSRLDDAPGFVPRDLNTTIHEPNRQGEPWQVQFNVMPGASYRIRVNASLLKDNERWPEQNDLYVHGKIEQVDPRVPREHPCTKKDDMLDERGVCKTPRHSLYIGESIQLPLLVDLSRDWPRPQLYDSRGEVVPTELIIEEPPAHNAVKRWAELRPAQDLKQLSRYEVRYHEGTTNMFGAEFTTSERIFFVETRQGPLTLLESDPPLPLMGTSLMDVPLDQVFTFTFSGPVQFYNDGNDFILQKIQGPELIKVPVSFRERPGNVFEVTPQELEPDTHYTLTLTDGLRAREDGNGRALVDAPIILAFRTRGP